MAQDQQTITNKEGSMSTPRGLAVRAGYGGRKVLCMGGMIIICVCAVNYVMIFETIYTGMMGEIMIDSDTAAGQTFLAIKSNSSYTLDNTSTATSTQNKAEIVETLQDKEAVGEYAMPIIATTNTAPPACPEGQFYMEDKIVNTNSSSQTNKQPPLIPRVLYQTSKSRCLTDHFKRGVEAWRKDPEMSHVFHDDEAMDDLLNDPKWEKYFPNLKYFLKCVNHAEMPVMKADVWRLLIVWENGGIYADLDVLPTHLLHNNTIREDDDAFFTIDAGRVSQYFFAASPRHPLLYNAALCAIDKVLTATKLFPPFQTGPGAMKCGHLLFLNSTDGIHGLNQTTIQTSPIDGRHVRIEPESSVIVRDFVRRHKKNAYKDMGMLHYHENRKGHRFGGKKCWEFVGIPNYNSTLLEGFS